MIKNIFYISKILFLKLILCTTLLASDVIIPQQKPKDENINKINYNSHKKKWDLKSYKTYVVSSVPGEVIYGDKFRFLIEKKRGCNTVAPLFTFMTTMPNKTIYEIEGRNIPVKINNKKLTAKVEYIRPVFEKWGYWVFFSLDYSNLNEYSVELMKNFKKNNKFEIRIIDGLNFNAKQYFDILSNNWDLNEYPNEIKKAYLMCKDLALSKS